MGSNYYYYFKNKKKLFKIMRKQGNEMRQEYDKDMKQEGNGGTNLFF